jgi:hypothetical protein
MPNILSLMIGAHMIDLFEFEGEIFISQRLADNESLSFIPTIYSKNPGYSVKNNIAPQALTGSNL